MSRDVMDLEHLTRNLLPAAEASGMWDMLPLMLWAVREREHPESGELTPFVLPDAVWTSRPVPEVLEVLPDVLGTAAAAVGLPGWADGVELLGVVLVVEVWARLGEGAATAPLPRSGSIADDPNGVEARVVLAVGPGDEVWHAMHVRHDEPGELERATGGDELGVSGRVVDALRAILATMDDLVTAARS